MPERIIRTQRWLDLIALLLGRHVPMSVEEIMERVPAYADEQDRQAGDRSRAAGGAGGREPNFPVGPADEIKSRGLVNATPRDG
jgi:hypothetical protein